MCKNCDCEECTKENNENFRKHIESAAKVVDKWPDWKKNLLRNGHKANNDIQRQPVFNPHETYY